MIAVAWDRTPCRFCLRSPLLSRDLQNSLRLLRMLPWFVKTSNPTTLHLLYYTLQSTPAFFGKYGGALAATPEACHCLLSFAYHLQTFPLPPDPPHVLAASNLFAASRPSRYLQTFPLPPPTRDLRVPIPSQRILLAKLLVLLTQELGE